MIDILGFATTILAAFCWFIFFVACFDTDPRREWKGSFISALLLSTSLSAGWWIYG